MPTFWQWVKAGIGFTLGAGLVTVTAAFAWTVFIAGVLRAMFRVH